MKAMKNLDSVLKSRDITLPTKVHTVKAIVFPVVMYEREGWTIKKARHWRTNAFKSWCWKRFLRVLWTARRSNQSILKDISLGCALEGLMLKLKLQYFGHHMKRVDSLEKTLMLGGIGDRRRRGWQRMRWLDGITYSMNMSLCKLLACCDSWGCKDSDTTERLDWTELKITILDKDLILVDGEIKNFTDKQNLTEFNTTKPVLQQILKRFYVQ